MIGRAQIMVAAQQATDAGTLEKRRKKAQRKLEKQMKLAAGSQGQQSGQKQQQPEGLSMPQPERATDPLAQKKKKRKKQSSADAAQPVPLEANGAGPAAPPAADSGAGAAAPATDKKLKKKRRKQAAEAQEAAQPAGSTAPLHAEPDRHAAAPPQNKKKKKAHKQEGAGSAQAAAELASMAQVGDKEAARAGRPIQKAVYAEHSAVSAMSAADVAAWRAERRTVVDGCDLRPVPAFEHASTDFAFSIYTCSPALLNGSGHAGRAMHAVSVAGCHMHAPTGVFLRFPCAQASRRSCCTRRAALRRPRLFRRSAGPSCRPGATWWALQPPAPARRWPSACRRSSTSLRSAPPASSQVTGQLPGSFPAAPSKCCFLL